MIARRIALSAASAGALYVVLWIGVAAGWGWLTGVDDAVLRWCHDIGAADPAWVRFWRVLSDVLGPSALRTVAVVGIIVAVVRHRGRAAALLAVAVMPTGLLTAVTKGLSDRPRPSTALTFAPSTAFPSGHALTVMVAACVFTTLMWPRLAAGWRRVALVVAAAVVIAVGVSRVVLNVHHPSDVLAGWALGYLWFLLSLWLVRRRPAVTA